jgi:hypothetical protein
MKHRSLIVEMGGAFVGAAAGVIAGIGLLVVLVWTWTSSKIPKGSGR